MDTNVILSQREKDRIIEMCNEVDSLITLDPGNSNWELLDKMRLKMNDLLYKDRHLEAEELARRITLIWSGEKEVIGFIERHGY